MAIAEIEVRRQLLRDVLGRADRLVLPRSATPLRSNISREDALGLGPSVADDHGPEAARPLDLGRVAADGLAVLEQDRSLRRTLLDPAADVVRVGVSGDQLERDLLAAAADAGSAGGPGRRRQVAYALGRVARSRCGRLRRRGACRA